MLLTGLVGGVLAGLLGVGGGIVIVPMLELALQFVGVDASIRMHVAVATSLATIIPTSISSTRAHLRRQSVDVAEKAGLEPAASVTQLKPKRTRRPKSQKKNSSS